MPLSDTAIRKAKPKAKPFKLADTGGLYLLVQPSGSKWWRYKYRFAGKEKLLALGSYPETSLMEAREQHLQARKLLAAGNDPGEAKRSAKQLVSLKAENTFESIAREWHEQNRNQWSKTYANDVTKRLENHIFPRLGHRPLTEITTLDVLDVLRVIEASGALDMAQRLMQVCGQVFRYAITTGRAERNPVTDLRGALKTPVRKHHAYLKVDELPEYLQKLDAYDGGVETKLALKFLLLTFVRTTELRGAEWAEVNFEKAEWRIPAERMKMKDPHIVPLSAQAVTVLQELKKHTGNRKHLFPIPALVNARLLKPLGNFSPNSTKYFATADVLEMTKDRGWLVKVSNTICQHWQKQNARKKDHAANLPQNGHALLAGSSR